MILRTLPCQHLLPCDISDHNIIGYVRKINFKRFSPKVISFRDYNNYDINDFRNDVKTTDWKNVYRSNNVNDALQAFNLHPIRKN